MKKFVALYMATPAAIAGMGQMTPEAAKSGMDEWMTWSNAHKKGIVDLGNPLGKTKRITASGVSDMKNGVLGYSIVEGESADDAAKLFKDNPHVKMADAWIELVEVIDLPGM